MPPLRSLHRHAALGLGLLILRGLPPKTLARLCAGCGSLWFRLSGRRRRVAEENVRLALGRDRSGAERRAIALDSFRNLGSVAAELLHARRRLATRSAAQRFRYVGEWAALRRSIAEGRGALIVTGHLGNWEAARWALHHAGIPFQALVRTLDDPLLDRFITESRGGERTVIRKWGAARTILRAVRGGRCVAILGDQNAGKHGLFVPFFGLEAATFPLPGTLHARADVPLFVGATLREGDHFRVPLRQVRIPRDGSAADRTKAALVAVHGVLEEWIAAHPRQYNWGHRRWRTRPVGEGTGPQLPFYGRTKGLGAAWEA